MDDNKLNIEISASADKLKKGLNEAGGLVEDFGDKSEKSSKKTEKISEASNKAAPSLKQLSSALKSNASVMDSVSDVASELVEDFQDVSSSSESVSSSTKQLSSNISSGLVLALIGAAVSLLKYTLRLSDAAISTNELTKATKGYIGTVGSELATINSLLSVAENKNKSDQERQRALNKLSDLTDGYTDSLSLENIQTDKATKLTNKLAEAMIAQAKIKGLQSRISKVIEAQYENENNSLESQLEWYEKLGAGLLGYAKGGGAAQASAEIVTQSLKNQSAVSQELQTELDKLTDKLTNLVSTDIADEGLFSSVDPKKQVENFVGETAVALEGAIETLSPITQNLRDLLSLVPSEEVRENDLIVMNDYQQRLVQGLIDFNQQANQIISGGIAQTFGKLGAAIGDGLSKGTNVLSAAGGALLGALGGILIQLGEMAITTGIGILAIQTALNSLNPYLAIVAGIALIALGVFVSNKSKSIGGSFGGGGSGGSSSSASGAGSGGSRGSSVNSSGGGNGGGEYTFVIEGTKLVGVLSNTLRRNRALGGNLSVTGT